MHQSFNYKEKVHAHLIFMTPKSAKFVEDLDKPPFVDQKAHH